MCAGCDCLCDLIEMQPHCFGVDVRQDQPSRRATGRTGCAEDTAPFAARITWCARAGSTPGPFAGEGSLLPDAGFILEPYLKRLPLCMFWQGIGYEAGKVFGSISIDYACQPVIEHTMNKIMGCGTWIIKLFWCGSTRPTTFHRNNGLKPDGSLPGFRRWKA